MPKRGKRPLTEPRIASWSPVADSVGYIKISMFPGIVGIDVARDTDRAVRELDCSRLIVDLRGNCGGGIGGLRLMSYLTPSKLPVGYSVTRRALSRGYDTVRRFDGGGKGGGKELGVDCGAPHQTVEGTSSHHWCLRCSIGL